MRGKFSFFLLSFLSLFYSLAEANMPPEKLLLFKENKGQWPINVQFKAEINNHSIWLENKRITYQLVNENKHPMQQLHDMRHGLKSDTSKKIGHVFRVNFENSLETKAISASNPSKTFYNYFLSSNQKDWASNVAAYSSVIYPQIYKGVDLKIYGGNSFLKYDLELAEGNNGSQISFNYEGLNGLELRSGRLYLKTSLGTIEEHIPKAWQLIDGQAQMVNCEFSLKGNSVGFLFSKPLNPRYKTVIDPVLVFFTYSGSTVDNWANTAISDKDGNSYSAGTVYGPNFPVTSGAYDATYNGGNIMPYLGYDIGVLKFDPTGKQLLSCTYIGGSGVETPHSLTLDNSQNLVIMGSTSSANFPVTNAAFQRRFAGGPTEYPYGSSNEFSTPAYLSGSDIFILKLSTNGQNLLASTFLGGSGTDGIMNINENLVTNYGDQFRGDVIVGPDNSIYVASHTHSSNFPIRLSAQSSLQGAMDGIICKFNSNLSQLNWSTYFGGNSDDGLYSIQLLGSDNLAVCGGTFSSDLPTNAGSYQAQRAGISIDAVVAVYNRTSGQRLHSTYSSTGAYDQAYIVQTDALQNIYIFGQTQGSMPKSASTYGQSNGGQFLQKFNSTLSQLSWGTTFGSQAFQPNISPTALMIDSCNRIFMAGWGGNVNYIGPGFAGGKTIGLPISSDALQANTIDSSDFYFLVLGADARNLVYGTYYGSGSGRGEHVDGGTSRFDRNGTITQAVCGCIGENNSYQIGTPGSYSRTINSGNCNNGVLKINLFDLKVDFQFAGELKCPATLTLFNKSENGQTYTWFFGNGDSLQSNSPTITYKYEEPGKYQVSLKAFNPKTCTQEAFAVDSIFIPNPFPIKSTTKNDQYCVGDSLFPIFEDFAIYPLQWSPTIYLSDPKSYKPTVIPLSSVNYKITIKDPQGCELNSYYQTKNKEIDLGFGYEKSYKPCLGQYTLRFFSNRDSSDSYTWFFENGDTAVGPEVTRIYNVNGRFPVRLNGRKNNCIENAIDTITLSQPKINVIPDFSTFKMHQSCDQPSIKFMNTSLNGDAFAWDFGDGYKSLEFEPEHKYENPGTYKVTLDVYNNNCKTELVRNIEVLKFSIPTLITTNDDGINETLEIKGLEPGWKLDIYNRWGKQVYQSENYKNDWKAENLQEGTYFYNITFPDAHHCNGWVLAAKP